MSTSFVGEAAHFGRRASAFFGRMSVFMSALSIGDVACFGRVSAFFGRASVFMLALGRAFVLWPLPRRPAIGLRRPGRQ